MQLLVALFNRLFCQLVRQSRVFIGGRLIEINQTSANVILMIHISQEELLRKIEQEHKQLSEEGGAESEVDSGNKQEDMSSILPTCGSLRDRNNNSLKTEEEDEVQAVLITGKRQQYLAATLLYRQVGAVLF